MTQLGTREPVTGVITVADLLSRYSPATVDPEPATVPVSVQSILRREGRAPAAQEEFEVTTYADDEPRRLPTGALVKRGAIAAGVVLAAGSVLGAAIVTSTPPAPTGSTAPLPEETPSRPWLDQQAPAAVPGIAPTTATGTLDAGEDVDGSWMNTAFPQTLADAPATSERVAPPANDDVTPPVADTEDSAESSADDADSRSTAADDESGSAADDGGDEDNGNADDGGNDDNGGGGNGSSDNGGGNGGGNGATADEDPGLLGSLIDTVLDLV